MRARAAPFGAKSGANRGQDGAVPAKTADATYEEAMLDWAVAELLSPSWAGHDFWTGSHVDALRTKIANGGVASLGVYERSWLVSAIATFRTPIMSAHGPYRGWKFWRATVTASELSSFAILSWFRHPSFSFGDLSAHVRAQPNDAMGAAVHAINTAVAAGQPPAGVPIATVMHSPAPPLVLEGYKRSMAALWRNEPSLEFFLCRP
jgi:hypothetical protein